MYLYLYGAYLSCIFFIGGSRRLPQQRVQEQGLSLDQEEQEDRSDVKKGAIHYALLQGCFHPGPPLLSFKN